MPAFITFGRILFAVLFLYSGASKLFGIQATADLLTAKVTIPAIAAPYTQQIETFVGMPFMQLLAITVGGFEIMAGLMIAVNVLARFFAILLIIFVCFTTFYFHDFWNQPAPDNAKTPSSSAGGGGGGGGGGGADAAVPHAPTPPGE